MNYEKEIFEAMHKIYANENNRDKYGQVPRYFFDVYTLANDMSKDAFEYLESGKSIYGTIRTYGSNLGTYKAVNPESSFYQQSKNYTLWNKA